VEVDLVQEHVRGLDPVPLADITTADAVAQGPTVLVHVLALTVAAHHLGDIHLRPSFPTSSLRPATTATATPSPATATATVEVEDLATRESVRALGRGPALRSKWIGTGTESGRGTETAAPSTSLQRNTNTSEEAVTEETGGTGRGLGLTTGTERESVATKANTTAVVGTQDIVVTGAETHQQTSSGADSRRSVFSILQTKSNLACSPNVEYGSLSENNGGDQCDSWSFHLMASMPAGVTVIDTLSTS